MPQLPLYRLTVEENEVEGMDFVGFVDSPAHIKKYVTMSAAPGKVTRYHFNDEKRIVKGVIISTYQPIYRRNDDGFEYNVYFTKEDAAVIRDVFAKKGYHNNVNLMHDMSRKVENVALIEMITINDDRTNIPAEFADQNLQKGSVIFGYKVFDDKAWKFIKENGTGFSLEGWFKDIEVKLMSGKMKKVFAIISQVNEWEIEIVEDTIGIGTQLNYKPREGEMSPVHLSSGEYSYKGSSIMVNAKGVVVMIDGKTEGVSLSKTENSKTKKMKKKSIWEKLGMSKPGAKKPVFDKTKKDKYAEATTVDGQKVMWDGALEVGTPIFMVPEGEEPILAPAGDLAFEYDGANYAVTVDEEGLIATVEVVEMDSEDPDEMAAAMAAKFAAVEKAYDAKFAAFKKESDKRIEVLASEVSDLTEAVEKLAEKKTGHKSVTGSDNPGWKGMKK